MKNELWTEKYRPKKISDLILPSSVEKMINEILESKFIPNMIFYSSPGTGKTTTAKLLAKELNYTLMHLNASLENSVDDIRMKVKSFSTTLSLKGTRKLVFLDEADRLSVDALNSLKVLMEETSDNCSFIFATNYLYKFPEPIISRVQVVRFEALTEEEAKEHKKKLAGRLLKIYKTESGIKNVTQEIKKILYTIVQLNYPDFRKSILELQRFFIEEKNLKTFDPSRIKNSFLELFNMIKDKRYRSALKYALTHFTPEQFYTEFYRKIRLNPEITEDKLIRIIEILSRYQFQNFMVVDKELNMAACIAELVGVF